MFDGVIDWLEWATAVAYDIVVGSGSEPARIPGVEAMAGGDLDGC